MKAMKIAMKPHLQLGESAVRAILGQVRTIVLEWSLTLEKRDVVGEDMTFSANERQQASAVHIGTFIQNVADSQLQVNSPGAIIQQDVTVEQLAEIKRLIGVLDDAAGNTPQRIDEVAELRAERDVLLAQANSPKPKRSVVPASLVSLRAIIEARGRAARQELAAGSRTGDKAAAIP